MLHCSHFLFTDTILQHLTYSLVCISPRSLKVIKGHFSKLKNEFGSSFRNSFDSSKYSTSGPNGCDHSNFGISIKIKDTDLGIYMCMLYGLMLVCLLYSFIFCFELFYLFSNCFWNFEWNILWHWICYVYISHRLG